MYQTHTSAAPFRYTVPTLASLAICSWLSYLKRINFISAKILLNVQIQISVHSQVHLFVQLHSTLEMHTGNFINNRNFVMLSVLFIYQDSNLILALQVFISKFNLLLFHNIYIMLQFLLLEIFVSIL